MQGYKTIPCLHMALTYNDSINVFLCWPETNEPSLLINQGCATKFLSNMLRE